MGLSFLSWVCHPCGFRQGSIAESILVMKRYFVYIMASQRNGTLYVGITNDIARRAYEHKNDLVEGFTKKYKVHQIVHVEEFEDVNLAILREKQLKRWKRSWKIRLIEETNSKWKDLSEELI